MALKRKRSTGALSSSMANDSSSPLPFFYTQSKPTPTEAIYQKPTWNFPTYSSGPSSPDTSLNGSEEDLQSKLNARTRKRHRDNRPPDQSIYASTISKLYDAQRLHPHAEPVFSAESQIPAAEERVQKSTLHSFWNIDSAPSSQAMAVDSATSSVTSLGPELKCEDCDASLRHSDSMDVDTGDGSLGQECACKSCRRQVCDGCAVLGLVRVCLPCATSRR